MTEKLHVHELKLDNIYDKYTHPNLLVIGDESITTRIVLNILNYETTSCKIIIAPNKRNCLLYSEKIPDAQIYYEYNDKICKNIMLRQRLLMNRYRNKKYLQTHKSKVIIILDHYLSSDRLQKDSYLHNLLLNNRCYNTTRTLVDSIPPDIPLKLYNFTHTFVAKVKNNKKERTTLCLANLNCNIY